MTRRCPICTHPTDNADYAPFCSKRCADVDLQRWFAGAYAVPVVEPDEGEDTDAQGAGRGENDPL